MEIVPEIENDASLDTEETRNDRLENGPTPSEDETECEVPDEQPAGLLQVSDQAFLESPSVFEPIQKASPGAPVTRSPSCWDLSDQQAESLLFPDTNGVEDLDGESSGNREEVTTSVPSSSTLGSQLASRETAMTSREASSVSIAEAASIVQVQRSSNTQAKRLRIGSPKWYYTSSSPSSSER
ncbi:uncharacterized protein APUU_30803A [Aspergillus puulaauensis]|uniref:Uncharacterized protein n=1 Tax=Aspergillus puulaauensis TaxID=1220207 RepID=A0A7R7XKC6_9EURO|nr:uncharacterized protein APUU_30803A [Aspergillus puulaauensis]BCS22578.1 hypothetical protein APUU_30803A [Aspergillus puulaauensis]